MRARIVAAIPRWYSPWAHLAFPSLVGLTLVALALWRVEAPTIWELLTVPITYVVSNAIEWRAHKHLLHKRTWYAPILYDRHTPLHHNVYLTEDMAMRSTREFQLVLIPAFGVLLIFAGVLPFAAGFWLAGYTNIACLFIATSMLYVLSYEWLHLAFHAPAESFIGRMRLIAALRRHHAIHHHPERMQKWNFNVTVPLWDFLLGTIHRADDPRPFESRSPVISAGSDPRE